MKKTFLLLLFASPLLGQNVTLREPTRNVAYHVPEAYELVNVAFALTQRGRADLNMVEHNSDYYRRVMARFDAHRQHPFVRLLDRKLSKGYGYYLYSRYSYVLDFTPDGRFRGGRLRYSDRLTGRPRLMARLLGASARRGALRRFARDTGFRAFFAENRAFYEKTLAQVQARCPVADAQDWLEAQFPARYDAYALVVSPLVGGTHSTTRFGRQCVMWVSDAAGYDTTRYTEAQIRGIYTGVVFTEIDHNYVNPVSDRHRDVLDDALSRRDAWTAPDGDATNYGSPYAVFNEYMTHAVYLLYERERLKPADFEVVKASRLRLMVQRRKFLRFAEFYDALAGLYDHRAPGQTLADLYPAVLNWCRNAQVAGVVSRP